MRQWSDGSYQPDHWEGTEEYRRVRFAVEQERIERKQKLEMVNEFLRRELQKRVAPLRGAGENIKPKAKAKGVGN
jgi:hypothetical protein